MNAHHEQSVICTRTDDPDLDAILRIPSSKAIEHVDELPGIQVVDRAFAVDLKGI
jgi:hypothetical protein